jgi:Bifunctional DNA primase/polymerase, N-terminal
MDSVSALSTLYSLVGDRAVLLPLPFGEKRPANTGWQNTTFERTREADYQEQLSAAIERQGNIGVLLTDGLVSIDIDDNDDGDEFAALNPRLTATLRTRGARGCNHWLRMTGDYPHQIYCLKKIDGTSWGEWRGGGGQTVIEGQHPSGVRYQRLVEHPAIEVAFADINWPASLVLPWVKKESPAAELDKRISAYIAAIPGAVSFQGGHSHTFKVACKLVNGWALSASDAMPYLQAFNQRCQPIWTDKELAHKLDDAEKAPHKEPRGYLLESGGTETQEPIIDWTQDGPTATRLTNNGYSDHKAIYPKDSILENYMEFVRDECEAVDAFILGSIMPVCAAQLARRVRFPWGSVIKFPNLFVMLAGPAGDRKSSAIEIAKSFARENLPSSAFLPVNFSPESLFDEYDIEKGGRVDKFWPVDDANIVLTDWRQTGNGERVASRFLSLYDCGELTENFRRNKEKNQPVTKRVITQTSTSILFGGTFNVACFQGQSVRAGIARRFIFYAAEGFGRTIRIPELRENGEFAELSEMFSRLNGFSAIMGFTPDAESLWNDYQDDNRVRKAEVNQMNDAESSRLASEPMQTLKIAMIFQACACAKQRFPLSKISKEILECAMKHMTHNLASARFLDSIANRESDHGNAEILLAKIRKDFQDESNNGTIFLRRNDITCKYAPHSGRQGAWTPNDIFLKFMPILIRQNEARLHEKKGKLEVYAIRDQD